MDNQIDLYDRHDNQHKTLAQLQRERTILAVIRKALWEKKENGDPYNWKEACAELEVSYKTWRNWVGLGYVAGPMQQVSSEISQIAQNMVLPYWHDILRGLVELAQGRVPNGSDIRSVKATDMLRAINKITEIVPIEPLGEHGKAGNSELEHIQSYQPKQININLNNGDFVYQGSGEGKRFGEMKSIEGDYEETS